LLIGVMPGLITAAGVPGGIIRDPLGLVGGDDPGILSPVTLCLNSVREKKASRTVKSVRLDGCDYNKSIPISY